eukprot:RCo049626
MEGSRGASRASAVASSSPLLLPRALSKPAISETKRALLAAEGLKPDSTELYIPSYFRSKPSTLDTADMSSITLGSLEAKLRDLPLPPATEKGKGFTEIASSRLSELLALGEELQRDFREVVVSFAPGKLCDVLDEMLVKAREDADKARSARDEDDTERPAADAQPQSTSAISGKNSPEGLRPRISARLAQGSS